MYLKLFSYIATRWRRVRRLLFHYVLCTKQSMCGRSVSMCRSCY